MKKMLIIMALATFTMATPQSYDTGNLSSWPNERARLQKLKAIKLKNLEKQANAAAEKYKKKPTEKNMKKMTKAFKKLNEARRKNIPLIKR